MTIHASAGCPQGGVLSLTLWCLVVDLILWDLKCLNLFCIRHADDFVIVVRRKFTNTFFSIMTEGLKCREVVYF